MKKCSFFFVLIFLFSACSNTEQQQYVKCIVINQESGVYTLGIMYYDFSQQEENYSKSYYSSDDIYLIGAKAMDDKNYNFRLCENIALTPSVYSEDIDSAVYVVNSLRVSPSADLLLYTNGSDFYSGEENFYSPLYDLSLNENGVTANLPLTDSGGNAYGTAIINDGNITEILDTQQHQVLGMVMNTVRKCGFTFRGGSLWAELYDIHTRFSFEDDVLIINMTLSVKERKGMSNSIETRHLSDSLMKSEISNLIYDLYNNIAVQQNYNIHWYCGLKGTECRGVKVKIAIK